MNLTTVATELTGKIPTLPKANQTPKVYIDYLKSLKGQDDFWDRGKGWSSYLQGQALNLIRESQRCNNGDYGRALKDIKMKPGTAYACRRIAIKFSADDAKKHGYTKMLRMLGWSSLDTPKGLPEDRKNSKRKPLSKTAKITVDNLPLMLTRIVDQTTAMIKMPAAHLGRDEARPWYENRLSETVAIRRNIDRIVKKYETMLAKIDKQRRKVAA